MKKYLVLLDTDKIKRYIFSTNRLKLIRGASSILAELNEKEAVKNRVGKYNGEYIFAGGGQVMAEFNSAEKAEEFISAEKAEYEKLDAFITGIKEEYTDGFENVVQRAQIKLRRAKEERAYVTHLLSNPFFKTCQLCGVKPASKLKYDNFVCTACERKMDGGERIRKKPEESPIYAKFLEFVEKQHRDQEWKKAKFTEDLSELGKLSKPENYIGLICADGNRMGERLFKRKSKAEYQDLSKAIESGLQESVFESLLEYIPNPCEEKIPFEFVIMGGDDLIMITPAEKAIPIALKTLEKFEDIAKERGAEKFTLSAGVVIAHAKYPISSFTQRGENLLESAKRLNKEYWYSVEKKSERPDISTIDYLVVTTPSTNPVDIIREKDLVYTMGPTREYIYKLTQRPFTLEKACKVRDTVNEIKKSGLSRSRLYSLSDSLLNGKNQSILTILSLINRLKGEEKNIRHLFEKIRAETDFYQNDGLFPWNSSEGEIDSYDTPFLDILEIYDFIEEERE
jgi:ubiquitin